jgi:hypothetical protein
LLSVYPNPYFTKVFPTYAVTFGNINNHDQLAWYSEERKFTGQEYDRNTNLNYMDARYEGPNLAQGSIASSPRAS